MLLTVGALGDNTQSCNCILEGPIMIQLLRHWGVSISIYSADRDQPKP